MSDDCTCGRLRVGRHITNHRSLNYDCPEHGRDSEWYNSPEQVAKREADRLRLRELQEQARQARLEAQRKPNE